MLVGRENGDKPALVFVHGFLGGSAQWAGQRDFFSVRHHVVTPDLPGFGENAHMNAPDKIADYAHFVLDGLSKMGIDRFQLIGHSMGGMIVQEMVAIAPQRVGKLVLYGTGAAGNLPQRFETFEVSRQRALSDGAPATADRISATWFLRRSAAAGYDNCAAIARKASMQAICAGLTAMEPWSQEGSLAKIAVPTLVLWGDRDRTYSWQQTRQLWQTVPDAGLAVIPGCAHAVHLEKPAIFNAVLDDFLSQS